MAMTETRTTQIMGCLIRQTKNCDVYEIQCEGDTYGKVYVPKGHADGAHVVRITVFPVG
jgi:hypothetical protein